MLTVVALGGNALLRRDQPMDLATQRRNAERAADAVARVAAHTDVVITHGNGPQVGLLAAQAEQTGEFPGLDVSDAESEGLIGYLLAQALRNAMPDREVVSILTQTLVNADDPAFTQPSKFIGRRHSDAEASRLQSRYGWQFRRDGDCMRRVVPSPEPVDILERSAIEHLLRAGVLVIAAGGGGIPVTRGGQGHYIGQEAVVDKDKVSAVLADCVGAGRLLLLTDVDAVYVHWNTARQQPLRRVTPAQLAQHDFADGSMAPKVAAACRFVKPQRAAAIGALDAAAEVFAGRRGTQVQTDGASGAD